MVAKCPQSTVVADYEARPRNDASYQSEADMERELIEQLQGQAYDYLPITGEKELVANLRHQLERLNDYRFTDREWEAFFKSKISSQNLGIAEKTAIIQEDHVQVLTREDGTTKNIYLIDKRDIHRNNLQVINQYVPEGGQRDKRYDVTILVNGLPLVHVELKRRGVDIKEPFNQIRRYNRESLLSITTGDFLDDGAPQIISFVYALALGHKACNRPEREKYPKQITFLSR